MATIPTNPSDGDTFTDGVGVTWTYNSSSNKWLIPVSSGSSGGGGGVLTYQDTFGNPSGSSITGTFTAPYDGTYRFSLVGGGGTGWQSNTGGSLSVGAGGGGGACILTKTLTAGTSVSYTLAPQIANSGRDNAGFANSSSSATIDGTTITAGGGGGGGIGTGGTGGSASGGDLNYDGQQGPVGNPSATGGRNGIYEYSATVTPIHYAATTVHTTGTFHNQAFLYDDWGTGGVGHTNASSYGLGAAIHIACYI
jgi:hypothetical protein